MEWAAVSILFTLVAVILVWPLWRHTERPLPVGLEGGLDAAGQDARDEKKRLLANLRTLRLDFSEGKVAEADFRSQETEYEQQLAAILEKTDLSRVELQLPVEPRRDLHRLGSLVLLVLVGASSALLFNHYWKTAPLPANQGEQAAPDVDAMVKRLEARLAANPNDAKGQVMMARSYANLGRAGDAMKAWKKALELEPGNTEALGGMVVMLLQSADENSVNTALPYLEKMRLAEPQEPAWLWYQGIAFNLLGRQAEAKAALEKMLPMLPPESENAAMVREALAQLAQAK